MARPKRSAEVTKQWLSDLVEWARQADTRDEFDERLDDFYSDIQIDPETFAEWMESHGFDTREEAGAFFSGLLIGWEATRTAEPPGEDEYEYMPLPQTSVEWTYAVSAQLVLALYTVIDDADRVPALARKAMEELARRGNVRADYRDHAYARYFNW